MKAGRRGKRNPDFGRTAAVHVVEQVEERVNSPRTLGFDGRVAWWQINRDVGRTFALDFLQRLGGGGYSRHGQTPGNAMTAAGAHYPGLGSGGMTSSLGLQNTVSGAMDPGASMQGSHPGQAYDHGMGLGLGGPLWRDLLGSGVGRIWLRGRFYLLGPQRHDRLVQCRQDLHQESVFHYRSSVRRWPCAGAATRSRSPNRPPRSSAIHAGRDSLARSVLVAASSAVVFSTSAIETSRPRRDRHAATPRAGLHTCPGREP